MWYAERGWSGIDSATPSMNLPCTPGSVSSRERRSWEIRLKKEGESAFLEARVKTRSRVLFVTSMWERGEKQSWKTDSWMRSSVRPDEVSTEGVLSADGTGRESLEEKRRSSLEEAKNSLSKCDRNADV